MPSKKWVQTLIAALMVILVGAILAFSEETTIDVRAEAEDGKVHKVTVDVDGTVQEIELDDLADGESRTIGTEDDEITVTRDGDVLLVTTPELDGVAESEKSFRKIFVVADDDGEETKVIAIPRTHMLKVLKNGDAEWRVQLESALEKLDELEWTAKMDEGEWRMDVERALKRAREQREKARAHAERAREKMKTLRENMGQLRERLEKLDLEQQAELNEALLEQMERLQDLRIEVPEIDLKTDWMVVPAAPPVPPIPAKMHWISGADDDSLVYRCDKDDVTVTLPDSAAGRTIECPVCGEPMEQVDEPDHAPRIIIKKKIEKPEK